MADSRKLVGGHPVIGIRPIIDARRGALKVRESLEALAVELASRKITVNCIAPGVIETEMIKEAPMEHILPTIPMGRVGKPEEVASLAVYLLSEGAGYITRQVISVNGGII